MTEQLYRWVKASERKPEARVITKWLHGGDPEQERIDILGKEQIESFSSPSEIESIEWLEPYAPSLNAGSLEEAAKAHSMKIVGQGDGGLRISAKDLIEEIEAAFLAGAAYVKGGGNITADVMMDVYRTVQVDGSIKEGDKLSTTFRWIYELVQESIKPSRPSLDVDKVVDELRKANPYCGEIDFSEDARIAWEKSCNKLQELLNQSN